ncbi:TetR/AcrR family transcriptional regulator [Nonomuraea sp. KC401]|uniref:TetR/AcrR family transcriptional regulator n=1 Tax=unclassified Nonomuraea TaxID=2593643 RepID=UPI0010FD7BD8|nr:MULTISPECIES: TetR/AcrR family transcriptional regulator [unclassified Nonomuraea]NBE96069.1 TetR family transcriptional regulator [Nonomuraea sp. K271]TLF80268.1 TetR/AcrR family transcriptional regulator [Nonomuraea sp. KC401]
MPAASSRMRPAAAGAAGLRADALHNRNRILEAAREAFGARGLDVPMAAIARRAGVGVATLYRRFPTRESLVEEVFADELNVCSSAIDDALADADPWRGFCTVIEQVTTMQVVERGFSAALLTRFTAEGTVEGTEEGTVEGAEDVRARSEQRLAELVRRAKAAGRLRADFDRSDLTLLLMANGGLAAGSTEVRLAASRRHVAYLLEAFRADRTAPAGPLPPPAPLGPYPMW